MFSNKSNTKVYQICFRTQKSKCVYNLSSIIEKDFAELLEALRKAMKNKEPSAISMVLDDFEDLFPDSDLDDETMKELKQARELLQALEGGADNEDM